jgi:glutamyl-tRNA synthetase
MSIITKKDSGRVRVRFAPSPTGPLHLGGIRTALYNYLFAKKHGGDFILRIEDTDAMRFVPGAEEYIIEALKWCGISPNEGVGFGDGPHAPYRQSERKSIYKEYAIKLVELGHAYYAFDTGVSLEERRAVNKNFMYNGVTRESLRNSLTLSSDEVKSLLDSETPYVIRFKIPRNTEVVVNDIVRGAIRVNTNTLDDKVLFKSDGMPTYHLANIVDDHLMGITHVIRGEEWLPSAPLHVLLYEALEWDAPEFCHLALILGPNGKMSKRDMDSLGFPVYPLDWTDPNTGEKASGYREMGFLPEAFINMLAFIGWNPGNGKEIMGLDEMAEVFDLRKVQRAGAKFDPKKAEWYSKEYMRVADDAVLVEKWIPDLWDNVDKSIPLSRVSSEYRTKVVHLLKEKVAYLGKFWENGSYFFIDPTDMSVLDELAASNDKVTPFILSMMSKLIADDVFDMTTTKACFDSAIAESGIEPREAGKALRAAVCGNKVGPPMFDILVVLGKNTTLSRLKNCATARS